MKYIVFASIFANDYAMTQVKECEVDSILKKLGVKPDIQPTSGRVSIYQPPPHAYEDDLYYLVGESRIEIIMMLQCLAHNLVHRCSKNWEEIYADYNSLESLEPEERDEIPSPYQFLEIMRTQYLIPMFDSNYPLKKKTDTAYFDLTL